MNKIKKETVLALALMCFVVSGCGLGNLISRSSETNNSNYSANNLSNSANNNLSNSNTSGGNYKDFVSKANEIAKSPLTENLSSNAAVKGKVALVIKPYEFSQDYEIIGFYSDGTAANNDYELEQYGLSRDRLATSADEIDTLVKTTCNKGKKIGNYTIPGYAPIPGYSMVCNVEIADYKNRTVVAKKTFENKEREKSIEIRKNAEEYINLAPSKEIRNYVKGFPKS